MDFHENDFQRVQNPFYIYYLFFIVIGPSSLSVKTASLGTLGRVRPPLPVTVPSAPEPLETSRMLDGSESVSILFII